MTPPPSGVTCAAPPAHPARRSRLVHGPPAGHPLRGPLRRDQRDADPECVACAGADRSPAPVRRSGPAQRNGNELRSKVSAYASAEIPVYVIVNRRDDRIHVLTDPCGGTYRNHHVHAPGQRITLPASLGAEVTLDVGAILEAARP
ncbi:Uma2 family endonuclease [Streptomyces sp. NBRC 110611]|uniref:Uma2 family endonuclease n=1 Tax=Streptomyces sp. NBRC 110611 TaxID=1621259 RepID=UPI00099FD689|nr:Uma2 family endonuclease [Streptomyces sp. NBRC 110611]